MQQTLKNTEFVYTTIEGKIGKTRKLMPQNILMSKMWKIDAHENLMFYSTFIDLSFENKTPSFLLNFI